MTAVETKRFGHVPTVLLYEGHLGDATNRGCILCYHGLSASKDSWVHDLAAIARRGFLVVGVDNVGHGQRRYGDFEERFSEDNPLFGRAFVQAVLETAKETPLLVDALIQANLVEERRLGALGVSMGGFITYSAILHEPRLKAAVTIVGSPEWWMLDHPDSPHLHADKFKSICLLSQTAGKDDTVPSHYARAFHERLSATHKDYEQRFDYQEYPDSDHMMNPGWEQSWDRAIGWFERHL